MDRRYFQYCVMDTDRAYIVLCADTLEEIIKRRKTGFPGTTLQSMQPTIRGHQGCLKKSTAVMVSSPCAVRPTTVSGRKKSSSARGSAREPTRSPKTSTWMFCCRRSLDPVPTEGSAQWTTRYLPTSRRRVASRTSTQNRKYWQMGSLQHH